MRSDKNSSKNYISFDILCILANQQNVQAYFFGISYQMKALTDATKVKNKSNIRVNIIILCVSILQKKTNLKITSLYLNKDEIRDRDNE